MTSPKPDVPDGFTHVRTLPLGNGSPEMAWSPDGGLLAVAPDQEIRLWDQGLGTYVSTLPVGHHVWAMAFAPDGEILASAGRRLPGGQLHEGAIYLWNARSGQLLGWSEAPPTTRLVFSPHGNILASGHLDGARLWDVSGGEVRLRVGLTRSVRQMVTGGIAFDPAGQVVAIGSINGTLLCDVTDGEVIESFGEPSGQIHDLSIHPSGLLLASAARDGIVDVWDLDDGRHLYTLEGHTGPVYDVSFVADGRLLASRSTDGSIRFWSCATWTCVGVMSASQTRVAFHPSRPRLAVASERAEDPPQRNVDLWEFDPDLLLGRTRQLGAAYTTAKIVLVGESGVGKTGLGWRLAHDQFKEQASTHGQQFWLLDELGATRADGAQCEAILWDLAGQPDYRLIHALFLDDADLALVLFDPTRDDDPLHGVEYWLRQLGVSSGWADRPVILVAARADRGAARLPADEIEAFCAHRGVQGYVTTSALTGAGVAELVERMRAAISWDARPTTVTTETFKRIKDYVLGLKEQGRPEQVILRPAELRSRLDEDPAAGEFTDAEMLTAVGHLSNHGYVSLLRTSKGQPRILLTPELLNNVASSIVLEARRNPKGLGSLEELCVLSGDYRFPELDDLLDDEREVLLDSAVAMFLEHNVCFRETDPLSSRVYLVFPELINLKKPAVDDGQAVEETVAYTVSGAVENVYASLVVLLGYTSTFTRTNQWRNQTRYVVGDGLVCGFRLEAEREGELDFVLYFGATVGDPVRALFQGLFESFLARRDLTVRRYEPVACGKGHRLNRAVVREQLAEGTDEVFCTRCGERMSLPRADAPIVMTRQQSADLWAQRRAATQRSRFEQALFRLTAYVTQEEMATPECFVSYAWGDADQERWVEHELATDLAKAGIAVVLDRWENRRIGASVPRFVERVEKADRVIVVGTPAYRTKYDNGEPMRGFVVAAEGDLIGVRMLGPEGRKESVLPVLLDGTAESSLPPLLQGRVFADFRDAERYFVTIFDLILSLYQIPPRHPVTAELRDLLAPR